MSNALGSQGTTALHPDPKEEGADFPTGGEFVRTMPAPKPGPPELHECTGSVLGVPQTKSEVPWSQFWSSSGRKWKCNTYLRLLPLPETLTGLYLRCSSHASPVPPQIPQDALRIPLILHPGPPAVYQPFHMMTIWLQPPGRVELLP